jgi:hypothetical protein
MKAAGPGHDAAHIGAFKHVQRVFNRCCCGGSAKRPFSALHLGGFSRISRHPPYWSVASEFFDPFPVRASHCACRVSRRNAD